MNEKIKSIFNKTYNYNPKRVYFSPGRVNIIGGHTDYNGGFVLPFCIDLGISAAVSKRKDRIINVYSANLPKRGIISFSLDHLEYKKSRNFANYVSGMLYELNARKFDIKFGFDLAISGNLPRGGGLSSSAALLVLIAKIASDLNNLHLDGLKMALISKTVENKYIGVSCGIMDQFVIANGIKGKAIYLNSSNYDYEYVSVDTKNFNMVLINSNETRKLTESKYNVRQKETADALKILQKHLDITYLCDLSIDDFKNNIKFINNKTLKKRVEHVVYENHRVALAKTALEHNDFETLGKLLVEAHMSARNLYEISSAKLDQLVKIALSCGSLGSKMIGGGFGGSTLNIVKATELKTFISNFSIEYKRIYHSDPIITIVKPTMGVSEIK